MEFFKYKNKLAPARGMLLISEPYLPDPNFERTVVLLCEHNEEGSFGFVLNKGAELKVSDVMDELKNFDETIFIGGPVQQDTLHFIHRDASIEGGAPVSDGIFWGGSFETVLAQADTFQLKAANIRFFLGYSGWGAGQLEQELEADSWIVCDCTSPELIFETEASELWRRALDSMGGRFSVYANYPVDPSLN